ncbi:MAG: type II secretion system protein [Planctomycetota bacterium]
MPKQRNEKMLDVVDMKGVGVAPRISRRTRLAFTLVELLVVIVIIAILAALIVPAIAAARRTAFQVAIKAEIAGVETAIETYKNDVGGSYPPDSGVGQGALAGVAQQRFRDFKRHLKKAFPQHRESDELIAGLVGADASGTPSASGSNANFGGMTPAEACVFWLQRFSSDPRYPISGPGGPAFYFDTSAPANGEELAGRNWIIDYREERFGPRNDANAFAGRAYSYTEPFDFNGNGDTDDELRINLWTYTPASSTQPLVYFDASRGLHDTTHAALGFEAYPLKQLRAGATVNGTPLVNQLRLANEGKFQVLHCGGDGEWGDFGALHLPAIAPGGDTAVNAENPDGNVILLYPDGPFTDELADTVANFGEESSIEDARQ